MKIRPTLALAAATALVAACTTAGASSGDAASATPPAPTAKAGLMSADGQSRGEAMITEAADGLHVLVKAQGVTPGIHAVHIHTTGTCTGPDFTSAGGHWNPTRHQHGKDNPMGPHMGDMPNMQARPDGTGEIEFVVAGGTIGSGATPLIDADGAAVVIHAQADDYKTDPTGNAGGRVACGVVSATPAPAG